LASPSERPRKPEKITAVLESAQKYADDVRGTGSVQGQLGEGGGDGLGEGGGGEGGDGGGEGRGDGGDGLGEGGGGEGGDGGGEGGGDGGDGKHSRQAPQPVQEQKLLPM